MMSKKTLWLWVKKEVARIELGQGKFPVSSAIALIKVFLTGEIGECEACRPDLCQARNSLPCFL
jgi:hypothetical protein